MATSSLATPAATLAVLERHGLRTKKRLGQHFLIDDNIVGRIMALADVSASDVVVEVGPGIGTLTVALCDAAGSVVAVEKDDDLAPVLAETTAHCARLHVIHEDALRVSAADLAAPFGGPHALVANLPYAVAATVVLRFFEEIDTISQATVMVQSEVAERMAASPGTKEYGAYTVKLRLYAQPASRFTVPPGCFLPPPRVDSAVIRLDRTERPHGSADLVAAARVADAAFAQRRKTIRNSLRATMGVPAELVDAALAHARIDGAVRAETLEPEAFVELASAFEVVA